MRYENNVRATLNAGVSTGASSIQVLKAVSPYGEPPTSGKITLMDSLSSPTKIEILSYTGRTDNTTYWTLTGVTKGVESTTDQAWDAGDPLFQSFTAGDAQQAGATGAGSDAVFVENELIVTTDYELSTNKSAMSVGPVTVNSGVSVTIPSGYTWVVL